MLMKGIRDKIKWIYENRFSDLNKIEQDFITDHYMNERKLTSDERNFIKNMWSILGM